MVGAWLVGTRAKLVDAADRFHDQRAGQESGYRPCTARDILVHHMSSEADWRRIDSAGLLTC